MADSALVLDDAIVVNVSVDVVPAAADISVNLLVSNVVSTPCGAALVMKEGKVDILATAQVG